MAAPRVQAYDRLDPIGCRTESIMSFLTTMKLLIVASVVLSVMALAMRARAKDALYLFRNWREGLAAALAMFVVVPAIAVTIALLFDLKPEVKVAILLLSLSPVPPLLPKRQLGSDAEGAYVISLLVAAALASLVVMPVGLHVFGSIFNARLRVEPGSIATILLITIVAPMLAGLAAQRWLGERADRVSNLLLKVGGILLVACGLALLVVLLPAFGRLVGGGTLLALVGMIAAGLLAGYVLGGPSPRNRGALALAAATRHPGVAMAVAATNFPQAKLALVAILLYVVLNVIVAVPFLKIGRKRLER